MPVCSECFPEKLLKITVCFLSRSWMSKTMNGLWETTQLLKRLVYQTSEWFFLTEAWSSSDTCQMTLAHVCPVCPIVTNDVDSAVCVTVCSWLAPVTAPWMLHPTYLQLCKDLVEEAFWSCPQRTLIDLLIGNDVPKSLLATQVWKLRVFHLLLENVWNRGGRR